MVFQLKIQHQCGQLIGFSPRCYGMTKDLYTNEYAIVFDYVTGGNLRSYLQKQGPRLTWRTRVDLLCSIVTSIKIIHNNKIIHRDIHGGNILLEPMEDYGGAEWIDVKITDFGLSRPADGPLLTPSGTCGVVTYMAPEILSGQPHSQASDIYAIGILMWEIASEGKHAFGNMKHDDSLNYAIYKGLRPEISDLMPKCWVEVMVACWDNDPNARPTAEELDSLISDWPSKIDREIELDSEDEILWLINDEDEQLDECHDDQEVANMDEDEDAILETYVEDIYDKDQFPGYNEIFLQFHEADELLKSRIQSSESEKSNIMSSASESCFVSYISPSDSHEGTSLTSSK